MAEALGKVVPPWVAAALALLSTMFTTLYSAGYQSAKVESLERDRDRQEQTIVQLQRQIGGLHARIGRIQKWPSRTSEPSMKTDAQ